ncbi:MAG: shikimate kinase [Desulfobacterales bacterium]
MKHDSIILIGMAGVGKSTIGRQLAVALDYRFIDLDTYITERYDRTLQEIIDKEGEAAFSEVERQCMYEIELRRVVVAPGGSIIYHSDLMDYLGQRSTRVYLSDSFANISDRVVDQPRRGIVGLKEKTLEQIFDERIERYSAYADLEMDCRDKQPESIVQEIIAWLKEK